MSHCWPLPACKGWDNLKPVYEELPGWSSPTEGIRNYDDLPENARKYLDRMSELTGLPVDIVSTGAERNDTIIKRHPFA